MYVDVCFSDSPRYDTGSIETEDITLGVGHSQSGWFRSTTVVSHRRLLSMLCK